MCVKARTEFEEALKGYIKKMMNDGKSFCEALERVVEITVETTKNESHGVHLVNKKKDEKIINNATANFIAEIKKLETSQ